MAGGVNVMNSTEFDEPGWGWEALGNFAAGYFGSAIGIAEGGNAAAAFVSSGMFTMVVNDVAGDHDDMYDVAQSFVGGGLSGLLGKNLYKGAIGAKSKGFWGKWYGKGVKFGNEAYAGFFAFDPDDKFCKTPWYSHLGIYAAGFTNGLMVAGFEGWGKEEIANLDLSNTNSILAGGDFVARGLGTFTEFTLTSYAKYGKFKWAGFKDKATNGGMKNLGYLLTTYF